MNKGVLGTFVYTNNVSYKDNTMEKEFNGVTCRFKSDPELSNVIYEIEFSNGKKYIGQTIQHLGVRMRQHCADASTEGRQWNILKSRAIRKHKRFNVRVIEHCKTVEELNKREDEIIEEYKSKGEELYNVASGGLNNCKYFGADCVLLNKEFKVLKEFDRIVKAREHIKSGGGSASTTNSYHLIRGKYYIMRTSEYNKLSPAQHIQRVKELKNIASRNRKNRDRRMVVQINYNHDIENIIPMSEAKEKFGDSISIAVASDTKRMYGYYWMLKSEYDAIVESGRDLTDSINGLDWILKVDTDGNIVGEYYTVSEAAKDNVVSNGMIRSNLDLQISNFRDFFFIKYSDFVKERIDKDYIKARTHRDEPNGKAKVIKEYIGGRLIKTYPSIKQYAREKGIDQSTACEAIKRGKRREATLKIA